MVTPLGEFVSRNRLFGTTGGAPAAPASLG
jgi:hypothetical protein